MTFSHLHDSEPRRAPFPDAYKRMANLDSAIARGPIDGHIRHLVKLRASQINGCAYCIDMHVAEALEDGMDERRLHLLSVWREVDAFDDRERAALALTEAVTLVSETSVPREVWDVAAAQFSEDEMGALLWVVISINAWNRLAISTRMTPASLAPDPVTTAS
jgi:AhpD family alkylhydroperoxidase